MSFDEDRLPAISGIARVIAQHSSDDYLAGMWRSTLLESLSWVIHRGKVQRYRPAESRARSWSWAFDVGEISWCEAKRSEDSWRFEHKHQYFATLVRAECSLVDNDVFGRVRSGTMTLAGRVMPSLLSWLTSEETDPQEPGWRVATFDCLPYNKGMDDRFLFQFGADDLFNLDGPSPMTVHCLWLFSNVHSQWVGLILRQVGSKFERICMFSAALREGEVPWDVVEVGC
jgi:hypothetical protein